MANLFKPWIVRYLAASGRQVTRGTRGPIRKQVRASKWYGQYTADGRRRRVPLAKDKTVARQMLARLEREAEMGKAGVADPYAAHRGAAIGDHLADFLAHVRGRGAT